MSDNEEDQDQMDGEEEQENQDNMEDGEDADDKGNMEGDDNKDDDDKIDMGGEGHDANEGGANMEEGIYKIIYKSNYTHLFT